MADICCGHIRKNDNTGTIEGYVIETGLGFIISVDYNRFKEIFSQRTKKKEKGNKKREQTGRKNSNDNR